MNDIPLSLLFGALALLLLLSAFFSGSETALMTLNRYRLQHLVKHHHRGAIKAQKLLQRPDRLIGMILLGNNFVNILASSIATIIAIRVGGESSIALGAGILTVVILIFAEVTPKTLAAIKPELLAFPSAWIYIPMLKVFYPFVATINFFCNLLLRLFGIHVTKNKKETISKEELKSIVSEAESLMPKRYQNILLGILDLESATVEDIMTPRQEIVGIDIDDPIENIIQIIKNSPHTRLPVFKKSIDRVVGFLHLRSVLTHLNHVTFDKNDILETLIKPYFIPENTPLHNQLQHFKSERLRIGLVVDEYGDVQGLVTLEDLLQEIVGELVSDEQGVSKLTDGGYLVDASVTIRELNRITGWKLPTEGPKTINGLIIEFMETIPEPGTSVRLHGHPLEIIKRTKNSVTQVKFYPNQGIPD
ncbi:HlyC/CorC family transporter [Methylicorpusculum sp.]|uniref:HlyC/CorC family transporter n=1 Tax=Methylicorpusculum sp. TaxID=2713644 RepID=UPI00272FEC8C|nr:HlyC/CorC family transporter [Methylicorpusculum sp.]MDP2180578.1 HlyC/CorC family transporter [Methylicorpusculum sp.]MDP3527738.1 HlyC/CorC family transporter [Methylicorpusculum sp.]